MTIVTTLLQNRLERAQGLFSSLTRYETIAEKIFFLEGQDQVIAQRENYPKIDEIVLPNTFERYAVYTLMCLEQFVLHCVGENMQCLQDRLEQLICLFHKTELFYADIGGFLGYYVAILRFLCEGNLPVKENFTPPLVKNCQTETPEVRIAAYDGIMSLGTLAEVYVLGGSGDRLKLFDPETESPKPVASLMVGRHTLLQSLFRDLISREYWCYRAFAKQVHVPVILMTSEEKSNHNDIENMLKEGFWYNKGKKNIFYVTQPTVPVVTIDGDLAFNASAKCIVKPGGHGVVWKLLEEGNFLNMLSSAKIDSLLIRQVNNPLCGFDHTLASFVGLAKSSFSAFAFIGVPSRIGFAEGMLVSYGTHLSNVEYTEFDRLKSTVDKTQFPANTNILFADIHAVKKAIQQQKIPGIMVNAKTTCEVIEKGCSLSKKVARLESMMQSLSENILLQDGCLVALYPREKALSVAKKAYEEGFPYETPLSCAHDLLECSKRLFKTACSWIVPEEQSLHDFVENGPNCSIQYHPALGPFWTVIGQKIKKGVLTKNSSLVLEIAELYVENIDIDGAFHLEAIDPLGQASLLEGIHYSDRVPRAYIVNVRVRNEGSNIDPLRGCYIILEGVSEVFVENVCFDGSFSLTVQDGTRAYITQDGEGRVHVRVEPYAAPGFIYSITWNRGEDPLLELKRL